MSAAVTAGRVLRAGRSLARVLLVWTIATAALVALDRGLAGFAMRSWWQPPVAALLLGVLAGLIWPLVMRVALPLAFFTLGLGGFLLMGAGVLGIFTAIPGVVVTSFATSVAVALAMSAVAGLASSALAVDEDELFFRRARRRAARGAELEPCPPGVLFLQIDGLGHETARRAVRDGSLPTLAAWLRSGSHVLTGWHTDWSSQTGAAVVGILHGSNHDVPGFRWYDKERDRVVRVSHPEDAAAIERRHSDGRGLLAGDGASRGNLFTGDARYVSLTMSSLAHVVPRTSRRARRGRDPVGSGYYAYFANPVNAVRTIGVSFVDIGRELVAAARQRRADVRPRVPRGGIYPLARPGTTVISRDVVVSSLLEDVLAGRPVVYADFLGYDEVAHHSGVERADALDVLRSIDQQIGRLHRAASLAPRRYHLVCLSDHGQTQGETFADRFGETVEELVGRLCGGSAADRRSRTGPRSSRRPAEGWQVAAAAAGGGVVARRLRARVAGAAPADAAEPAGAPGAVPRVAPGVVVVVSGHVAMVSFPDVPGRVPLETIERHWPELLPALVDHPGVGFLLVHSAEHGPVVLGRDGVHRLATGEVRGADPLAGYGPHAAAVVARGSTFPHCADVVINSRYDPDTDEASPFEPHVGSHGGLGGPQQRGFLVHPRSFAPPGEIVGAEQLHRVLRGWLTDLGHPEPTGEGVEPGPDSRAALDRTPSPVGSEA
ncbi:alkaline phosphatase family protein [Geodermatophilus sp. YIM 151500]|uniref:phage holin family protein n=1 Tax=Geodermatophilus sp. YIM 151500 TaxID=2984531 RepID=UPI0021E3AE62|nr:phage holin family protein [Geodermatophilus sp. YIM 151500]MCV2490647.1 alkaline phosphatase family protein [Geodermatophilus sp. YIM 151500]